jgi:tetratricopeptide (TPR) repeat protein
VPEGIYSVRITFLDAASGQAYKATAENVEIVAGATTNIGTLVAETENDWKRILQAGDYGRASNEVIAQAYSKEWLDALPDSGSFLKTAFALYDVGRYQDALEVFQRMSSVTENNNMYEAISLVWQGNMLDLLGRRDEAVAAYSSAADLNVTDQIRHDQFGLAYSPSEYARERMQEPFTRVDNQMK